MAVTYAQFIVEYPEFSELAQDYVESVLTVYDGFLSGFGDILHDRAVYKRSALDFSEKLHSLPMAPNNTEPDKYKSDWAAMLVQSYRRGQVTGGGLT